MNTSCKNIDKLDYGMFENGIRNVDIVWQLSELSTAAKVSVVQAKFNTCLTTYHIPPITLTAPTAHLTDSTVSLNHHKGRGEFLKIE